MNVKLTVRMCVVAALVVLLIGFASQTVNSAVLIPIQATQISGDITTNTTWTVGNSPYIISSSLIVRAGVQLHDSKPGWW